VVEASVAKGAIHGVEFDALDEVIFIGHERVGDARSVTLHGSVGGAHSEVLFPMRRFDVSCGREETEQGETESAEDENQNSDDDAEKNFAHGSSGGIVADEWGGRLAGSLVNPLLEPTEGQG
jgi:hypothetical protein